jgi:hypothetical protein
MGNSVTERMGELGNRPAGDGKRPQNAKKMLFRRNKPKDLLKTQELAIFRGQNKPSFRGKNPPSKPRMWRKIHQLWGISLSALSP